MSWPLLLALLAFAAIVLAGQCSRWGYRSPRWRVRIRRRHNRRPNAVLLHWIVLEALDQIGDPDTRARLRAETALWLG